MLFYLLGLYNFCFSTDVQSNCYFLFSSALKIFWITYLFWNLNPFRLSEERILTWIKVCVFFLVYKYFQQNLKLLVTFHNFLYFCILMRLAKKKFSRFISQMNLLVLLVVVDVWCHYCFYFYMMNSKRKIKKLSTQCVFWIGLFSRLR